MMTEVGFLSQVNGALFFNIYDESLKEYAIPITAHRTRGWMVYEWQGFWWLHYDLHNNVYHCDALAAFPTMQYALRAIHEWCVITRLEPYDFLAYSLQEHRVFRTHNNENFFEVVSKWREKVDEINGPF